MTSIVLCRDVLAIRSLSNYILVGIGNELHVFDQSTFELKTSVNTHHQDVIHEIVRTFTKLIVFGGKYLSVYRYQIRNETIIIEKESSHRFNDWITAANFFSPDSQNLYILFAHNNLYLYNTLSKEYSNLLCEEKCILYCGFISVTNWKEAVIFSGTVFQEILIWAVNNKKQYDLDIPTIHRLKGHKGVIFSVFYDPLLDLIISTSDDRSVRLWKIQKKNKTLSTVANWTNAEIILKTTAFGHSARVWKSLIVDDKIISIGEDSAICIFTLDGQICSKVIAHGGATVWSIEISKDKSTIFTGGSDGSVNSWPMVKDRTGFLAPTLSSDEPRSPKYVSYLKSGTNIVFMDDGELRSYVHDINIPGDVIVLERYKSYCLMQVCLNRTNIVLASKDGYIDIFKEGPENKLLNTISESIMESKIYSLQWLPKGALLICGNQGKLMVLEISKSNHLKIKSEFILPPSRERWTTAATIVGTALVCGDRAGSVFVFSMISNDEQPQQIFSKIHGRLGVQSFGVIGKKIVSTGRDSYIRYYKSNENDSGTSLQALHGKKMPMEWVSKILKTDKDVYILGFKEMEFLVYSTRLNRLVWKVTCGGGHRSWDCFYMNGLLNFVHIRNKKNLDLKNVSCTFTDNIVAGYHIKEMHCLKALPAPGDHNVFVSGSEDCTLGIGVMSKSPTDKYNFKLLDRYDGHISCVKCIAVINLESSTKRTRNLVFSGGGRAQLKVWTIDIDDTTKGQLLEDNLTVIERTTFMLRGTDKDRRKTWLDNEQPYFVDPETRFMDISAYLCPQNKSLTILFVACSDGFLRVLVYDDKCHKVSLVSAIPYHNRCIIKVHSFVHEDKLILITMATDGFINFWVVKTTEKDPYLETKSNCSLSADVHQFGKWAAHQSGINSFDFKNNKLNKSNEYLLATGGDDNNLSLSSFTISTTKPILSVQRTYKWNSSQFHSAQITGIKFLGENHLISTGIDQRIVIFCYTFDDSTLSVQPVKKIMTFISDIQGLTILDEDETDDASICVYGQGFDVILIENGNE